ncbi:MAG: cysteine desulfurase family protein [Pseudomonadota bacterium]
MSRVYLDYNATAPLREEARNAMIKAMDLVGNPSSVHGEGRAAKGLVERARLQVSQALGAGGADIVFTSGATEAAGLCLAGRNLRAADIEHDAVAAWVDASLPVKEGLVDVADPGTTALQLANSETGIVQDLPAGLAVSDLTQGIGRLPFAFDWSGIEAGFLSAHKLGGPKGVGAAVIRQGLDLPAQIKGGGQELGRRSGTENLIGIAGFGAAIEAASRDLAEGEWDRVAELRIILEKALGDACSDLIFVGSDQRRLPNTTCFIRPGWPGETQVMVMDLAGFAISAGSACSSGKVKASRVLKAMGYSEAQAKCAVRVSLGPETTHEDVLRFAQAWLKAEKTARLRAA